MSSKLDDLSYDEIAEKDILEILGAEGLSEEEQTKLYEKMLSTIRLRVMDRFDEALSEEERQEFANILNTGTEEQIEEFYKRKGFDAAIVMAEEALKYKIELVAYVKLVKKNSAAVADVQAALNKKADGTI